MWLVMLCLWLWRGLMIGSRSCQVLLRARAAVVRLWTAGGARASVAFGWALRSGSRRLGCALVGAASYTNGPGMALLSPSMCCSSRERRGRCLMGMARYAILLICNLNDAGRGWRHGGADQRNWEIPSRSLLEAQIHPFDFVRLRPRLEPSRP